ncbi:tRNA (guanosine(46)-N7)-methyltransferase TrmB [Lachnospiraceae bacterium JLR.KK008]
MRLRNIPGSQDVIDHSPYVIKDAEKRRGSWRELFRNDHPLHIEVGMGKGRFLMELAARNPDINFVGIERYTSVLLRALQKVERLQETENKTLPNLLFICADASGLEEIFAEGEVSKIYLNFSDPWPKDRHARRRLPSREFLARYDKILKKDGRLEFKTDNKALFEFAIGELEPAGWRAEKITHDLYADHEMMRGNVMTEYEEKFSSAGNPIYKYIIYR